MYYSVPSVHNPGWFVVPVDYSLILFTLHILLFCTLNLFCQLHQLCRFQLGMTGVCIEFKRAWQSVAIHILGYKHCFVVEPFR